MQLRSLEVQGFKTFPDKTSLNFEGGITSVVGPNGSGKSNISDAMRWVLGEQSTRILRCSKMEDVIFSGTPGRRAQGYAEVTLNIDNRDRRLDFDNDNVAVTRRYYRSGESEYLINKTIVRLRDVNEMFMDTGLGRDGYSIIGQGKIDSIVAAKSEDRRDIFEEASGISRYRYRKEESERRLNRTEENLVRLRDILSELEERVEPLKQQAEKAEKFIAYDAEKKELEIGLWVNTLEKSGETLRLHSEKIDIAENQQREVSEQIEETNRLSEENYRKTGELGAQIDLLREEASALDEKALRTDSEISLVKNDIEHNLQQIKRVEKQAELAAVSEQVTEKEIAEKTAEAEEKSSAIEASREKLDAFDRRLSDLRKAADTATLKIEETAVRIADCSAAVSEKQIRLSSFSSSKQEINLREKAVADAILAAEAEIAELEAAVRDLDHMISETAAELLIRGNSAQGYELRLAGRQKKAQEAREAAEKLSLDAGEQERRAKLLSDLERNLEGFAQSVKVIMRESQRGLLTGVYGPITKIINTPRDYAVALETALGAAMQNIVVETEADAKAAIEYLKKNKAGRATFLPRVTIKGRSLDSREMEEMPGFVGIASQLCSCSGKFTGIKDSLLGRVAVAEDLDSAVSIAKRTGYRFRIVSLDGQVVNAGGSLTGGARAKNSGLLSRGAEIQRVTQKAAELRQQADELQQKYRERQQEVSECSAQLQAARDEYSSMQEDKIRFEAERSRFAASIENAQTQRNSLKAERETAGKRLEEMDALRQQTEAELKDLESRREALLSESRELTENRQDQIERCDDITAAVQEIRLNEYAARKDRDTLFAAIEELNNRLRLTGENVSQLREEIAELESKNRELEQQIEATKKRAEEFRAQAAAKREEIQETAEKRNETERKSAELRTAERELTGKRETLSGELARLKERSEGLQKEYDSIISKLWEEYELTRKEARETAVEIEDAAAAKRRLAELKSKIKSLGAVNVAAVVEYKEVYERYRFLKEQMEDVEKSKDELLKLIGDLTKQMREQFVERFAMINQNFGIIFKQLFGGGSAQLQFTDDTDVLSSGIEIKVHPPGKIVTHIESLSGGEKALVAISIYFAIMRVSPPPFCVLDEIEAALDDVNVSRFAQYLRRMSAETQFIVITHRRGTMEGSDVLYGVTMQDQGISKLLKLKTEAAEKLVGSG